jgi:hypothetical protein
MSTNRGRALAKVRAIRVMVSSSLGDVVVKFNEVSEDMRSPSMQARAVYHKVSQGFLVRQSSALTVSGRNVGESYIRTIASSRTYREC